MSKSIVCIIFASYKNYKTMMTLEESKETYISLLEMFNSGDEDTMKLGGEIFLGILREDISMIKEKWVFSIFVSFIKDSVTGEEITKDIINLVVPELSKPEVVETLGKYSNFITSSVEEIFNC